MIENQLGNTAGLLPGCLNCTIQLSALKGFECNPILRELAKAIAAELNMIGCEIAQLNMTLVPDVDVNGTATLNISKQRQIELGPELDEPVERGHLNLILHAQGKADHLHAAVTRALNHTWAVFPNLFVRLVEMQHFQPTATVTSPHIAAS